MPALRGARTAAENRGPERVFLPLLPGDRCARLKQPGGQESFDRVLRSLAILAVGGIPAKRSGEITSDIALSLLI